MNVGRSTMISYLTAPDPPEPSDSRVQAQIISRELLVKDRMRQRLEDYADLHHYTFFVGTWNVNGQLPPKEPLDAWLCSVDCKPHFYIIGFQELDLDKRAYVLETSVKEHEWQKAVSNTLKRQGDYKLIKLHRLVGIMILVYVKQKHATHVKNVSAAFVGTGIMGWMGNKGGVGIRLDFHSCEMCFITAHFAAHTEEVERRNEDFRAIFDKMLFTQLQFPKRIKEHDIIVWLGDFNYRISNSRMEMVNHITGNRIADLHTFDQLRMQMEQKKVFHGFQEGKISFRPTYKYDAGTDRWDTSEKTRVPSWCDRVLWKAKTESDVKLKLYDSRMQLQISDHKPVIALMEIGVRVIDKSREKKVHEEVLKIIDREENLLTPTAAVHPFEFTLGDITFLQHVKKVVTVKNTGQVPLVFEFVPPLESMKICRDWISIGSQTGYISPGETADIELEIEVNKKTVNQLTSKSDRLDDILVLRLKSGGDFFVCIQGNYIPSCFGTSLENLAHSLQPIRSFVPPKEDLLISFDHDLTSSTVPVVDNFPPPPNIPVEIWRMIVQLYVSATEIADLFLQPGLSDEVEKIRDHLDARYPLPLPGSGHSVAEALLLFLDVLPDPLVPFGLYQRCLDAHARWESCRAVLDDFPVVHKETFKAFIVLLRELHKHWLRHPSGNGGTFEIIADVVLKPAPDSNKSAVEGQRPGPVQSKQIAAKMKVLFLQQFLKNKMDNEPSIPKSLSVATSFVEQDATLPWKEF